MPHLYQQQYLPTFQRNTPCNTASFFSEIRHNKTRVHFLKRPGENIAAYSFYNGRFSFSPRKVKGSVSPLVWRLCYHYGWKIVGDDTGWENWFKRYNFVPIKILEDPMIQVFIYSMPFFCHVQRILETIDNNWYCTRIETNSEDILWIWYRNAYTFVDFKQTFDQVRRDLLLKDLKNLEVTN